MTLHGDRNQCCGCGEYFNSTFAFDKHRTGEHGKDRRCLSPEQMKEIGMAVNSAGFWISAAMITKSLMLKIRARVSEKKPCINLSPEA